GRGPDAHLFWPHGCAFAALHQVLEQTVHRLFSRRGCDVEGGESGLRGEVAQSFSCGAARAGAVALARATPDSTWLSPGSDSNQSNRDSTRTVPGRAPGSAQGETVEVSPSLPAHSEKRPNDLPARVRDFPAGKSARGIVHRGERSAPASP